MTRLTSAVSLAIALTVTATAALAQPRVVDTPIRVGQKVSDALGPTDPVAGNGRPYRVYRFEGDSGRRYAIALHSGDFDAYLRVLRNVGPISEEVASDDDGGEGTDALVRVRLRSRGTHYVTVEAFDDSLGAFDLELTELPDQPLVTKPIAVGQTLRGTLGEQSARSDRDWPYDVYTVRVDAARPVRAVFSSSSLEGFVAVGRMVNGRFQMLEESTDGENRVRADHGVAAARREGASRPRATFAARLPARGEYAVRVLAANPSANGSYAIRLEDGNTPAIAEAAGEAGADRPAPRARAARAGQDLDGMLGDSSGVAAGQRFEEWTISARAGERLILDLQSEEFDPYVSIGRRRGGSFTELGSDDDGGNGLDARLRYRVAEDGEYVIRAAEVKGESGGAYTLRVQVQAPGAVRVDRAPIAAGREVSGTIGETDPESDDGRRYDEWTYAAKAGERLTIAMTSTAFDAYVMVGRTENGEFSALSHDDDGGEGLNARLDWTAPADGQYVIRASELAGEAGGDYRLTVTSRAPVPRSLDRAPIAPGRAATGTIEESDPENAEGQRYDEWTFTARAGDRVTIDMRSEFDAFLFLGRGSGERFESLEQDDDGGEGTNAQIRFTVVEAGEYTVRASELRGERGGAYTLTLATRAGAGGGAAR